MKCIYFANKILYLDKAIFIYRNNSFSVTHGNEDVKKFSSVHWKDMKIKESKCAISMADGIL